MYRRFISTGDSSDGTAGVTSQLAEGNVQPILGSKLFKGMPKQACKLLVDVSRRVSDRNDDMLLSPLELEKLGKTAQVGSYTFVHVGLNDEMEDPDGNPYRKGLKSSISGFLNTSALNNSMASKPLGRSTYIMSAAGDYGDSVESMSDDDLPEEELVSVDDVASSLSLDLLRKEKKVRLKSNKGRSVVHEKTLSLTIKRSWSSNQFHTETLKDQEKEDAGDGRLYRIDTIVDCEEVLAKSPVFMLYYEQREEERKRRQQEKLKVEITPTNTRGTPKSVKTAKTPQRLTFGSSLTERSGKCGKNTLIKLRQMV